MNIPGLEIYTLIVGAMLVAGLVSVLVTIPKLNDRWKGVYYIAIGLNVGLLAVFTISALRIFGVVLETRGWILIGLMTSLFLVALELILVPYIHRLEHRLAKVQEGEPWNRPS